MPTNALPMLGSAIHWIFPGNDKHLKCLTILGLFILQGNLCHYTALFGSIHFLMAQICSLPAILSYILFHNFDKLCPE